MIQAQTIIEGFQFLFAAGLTLLQRIGEIFLVQVPLFFELGLGFGQLGLEFLYPRVVFFRSTFDFLVPGADQDLSFLVSKLRRGIQFPFFQVFQMLLGGGSEPLKFLCLLVFCSPSRSDHGEPQTKAHGG